MALTDPPHGFLHAPVCKAVFLTSLLATSAALARGQDPSVNLLHVLSRRDPWWRVLPALSCYGGVLDLLSGLQLTHAVRVVEREMGSGKFGAFLFLVATLALSLEAALSVRWPGLRLAPGPLPLLAAALTFYFGYVPAYGATLLRLPPSFTCGTGKITVGMAAAFLFLRGALSTAVPAAAGILAAVLYATDALPLKQFRLPRPVRRLFGLLHPLLRSDDPRDVRRRVMMERQRREILRAAARGQGGGLGAAAGGGERLLPAGGGGGFSWGGSGGGGGGQGLRRRAVAPAPPPPPPPPPPEEAIETLQGLGFDREAAIRALQATDNNVEAAANRLLGH
ncbi:unnamed protein product [Phaeothamnion confervicola]